MANPKIADLTVSQLKELIHDTIAESLVGLLTDLDQGPVLRGDVAEKLRQSIEEVEAGGKTIPLSELLRTFPSRCPSPNPLNPGPRRAS